MAEIRLDVDFPYTRETVWRALVDRRALSAWFVPGDWSVVAGVQFVVGGRAGVDLPAPMDVTVLSVSPAEQVVMRWSGDRLHAETVWELATTPGGCRLTLRQSGFLGTPQAERVRQRTATYARLLREDLVRHLVTASGSTLAPRVLRSGGALVSGRWSSLMRRWGSLAARWGSLAARWGRRGQLLDWVASRWDRLRRRGFSLRSSAPVWVALVIAAAPALVVYLNPRAVPTFAPTPAPESSSDPYPAGGQVPEASVAAGTSADGPGLASGTPRVPPSSSAGMAGGVSVGAPASPAAPHPTSGAAPAPPRSGTPAVTASFLTTKVNGKGNYLAELDLTTTAGTPVTDWTVVLTLPTGAKITNVGGAVVTVTGDQVDFTTDGVDELSAGQPLVITFKVLRPAGTTQPLTCTVNGSVCAGL